MFDGVTKISPHNTHNLFSLHQKKKTDELTLKTERLWKSNLTTSFPPSR